VPLPFLQKAALSMDLVAGLKQTIARLGFAKLGALAAVGAATLALIVWISSLPLEPKSLLYSGLDPAEAGKIGQRLDELKVPFEVKGDGTTIMVPASQVARARMDLAASGLPHQGGAGYELLDQQSPMNMTSFMQRIQRLRALEGELARTIVTLSGVRTARVHIVLPERETFARDTPKATASVAVTMTGAGRLSTSQAAAIRLLVSGAVPGMAGESVSVLDPSGVVIAADDSEAAASSRIGELKGAREQELRRAVTDLLDPLVGHDKLRVAASVELDGAREVSHEEKFDPLSQIERSKQIQVDQDATNETKAQGAVSVAQNLPNQAADPGGESGKTSSNNSRNGQTVNYEINSVRSDRVREAGELKRMTIAVVVDGTMDDKGHYQPRSRDELARMSDLIQAAVGFDVNRGDRVTVETMRFIPDAAQGTGADAAVGQFAQLPILWISIGSGTVLVFVVGLVVMRMRKNKQLALAGGQAGQPASALALMASEQRLGLGSPQANGQMAALASGPDGVNGQAALTYSRSESGQQALLTALFEAVDTKPDEALATLRAWIAGNA
jgi:flagellar M-ring protein FliF